MANYDVLKSAIQNAVDWDNNDKQISGNDMLAILLSIVNNTVASGYLFAGAANPTTNPGTPDQNLFYVSTIPGTYVNFDGIVVGDDEIAILKYNGTWVKDEIGAASINALFSSLNPIGSTNATWQVGKISKFKARVLTDYQDFKFHITQLGWFVDNSCFLFTALLLDSNNSIVGTLKFIVPYDSRPTTNIYYNFPLWHNGIEIGVVSFLYNWVDAQDNDHLFNSWDTTNVYIDVENIKYDFHESLSKIAKLYDTESGAAPTVSSLWGEFDTNFEIVSVENSISLRGGVLKKIAFVAGQTGTFTIGIGYVSAGNVYVEYDRFDVAVASVGLNEFDVSSLNKYVPEHMQIFIHNRFNGNECVKYGTTAPSNNKRVLTGTTDNVFARDGLYSYVVWETMEIDSIFAVKGMVEKISQKLNSVVKSVENKNYGASIPIQNLWGQYDAITPGVVTIPNMLSPKDGLLKSVSFVVGVSGTFTIGIGYIDQRGWYIENKTFNVTTEQTGLNVFDVEDQQIFIPAGQCLFIYCRKNATETIKYGSGNNALYGPLTGALSNGTSTYLKWEITEIDSVFTLKAESEDIKEQVETVRQIATDAYNNSFKVKDRQNNLYRLMVVNGELTIIPLIFSRALVLGNSVTIHGITEDYGGWYAENRGMAASTNDTDFVAFLQTGLRTKNNNAIVDPVNFAAWERTLTTTDAEFDTLLADYLANTYDLIVIRLGENVVNDSALGAAITALGQYLFTKWPNAELVITSNAMEDVALKNAQLSGAANALGVNYVDVSCAQIDFHPSFTTGQYWGYWKPCFYLTYQNTYAFIQAIFAGHPNDLGMLKIANNILGSVGYNQLALKHTLSITSAQNYDVQTQYVAGQVVSIACFDSIPAAANVSILDEDNNPVSFIIHDMTDADYYEQPQWLAKAMITFIAPNKNVTINIQ